MAHNLAGRAECRPSSGTEGPICLGPQSTVFVFFLLSFNLIGIGLLRNWIESVERWFQRSDSVVTSVNEVTNLLTEAELSHNFFIVTGDRVYGDAYARLRQRLEFDTLPAFAQVGDGSPTSMALRHQFDHAVRDRLAALDYSVDSSHREGVSLEYLTIMLGWRGEVSAAIQTLSGALVREEERLRGARYTQFGGSLRQFTYALFGGSMVLLVIAFAAVRRFRREIALRERAEAASRESERHERARAAEFQTLLETVPAVVLFAHDAESRIIRGSRLAYETLRLPLGANTSKTAFVGSPQHFRLCRNGVEIPLEQLPVQSVARSGRALRDTEIEVVFDDGETRYLIGSVEPLFDDAGKPRGAIAAFADVTSRREAERSARANEARWRLSLETGRLGFFEYDYETEKTRWDDSEFKLLGYNHGEILPSPETFFQHVHPEDLPGLRAEWERALHDGALDAEFRIISRDGELRWLGVRGKPICDESGRRRWFTGFNIDITRNKRIEEELSRAIEDRTSALNTLHAFMETAPLGIALLDEEARYRFLNQPLAAMAGASLGAVIGRKVGECVPWLAPTLEPLVQRVLKQGETVADFEIEVESPAQPGERHTWVENLFPIRGADESIKGAGIVMQDITERKRAQSEIAQHRDRLQELVEQRTSELAQSLQRLHSSERLAALGTLAAGLGHDLANLVLPIRARLESLAAAPLSPTMRADVVAIGQALDHLGHLSAGMRLMALDPSRERAASEATDLVTWWAEAQAVLRGVLPRHVRLEGKVEPGLGVTMPRHRLLQAVFNLAQNAGEFMASRPDGIVVVEVLSDPAAPSEHVLVRVRDNGPGMAPEVRARCFDPYFSTKGRAISTGMGLSLVRGLVESSGGTVEVDSELDRGTTFTLRIPRIQPTVATVLEVEHRPHVAAVGLHEVRQAALVAMIAERMNLKVERTGIDGVPSAPLWITDSASRDAVERYLGESRDHRVIYLGDVAFDPLAFSLRPECRGRIVALPARPAPGAIRDAIGQILSG